MPQTFVGGYRRLHSARVSFNCINHPSSISCPAVGRQSSRRVFRARSISRPTSSRVRREPFPRVFVRDPMLSPSDPEGREKQHSMSGICDFYREVCTADRTSRRPRHRRRNLVSSVFKDCCDAVDAPGVHDSSCGNATPRLAFASAGIAAHSHILFRGYSQLNFLTGERFESTARSSRRPTRPEWVTDYTISRRVAGVRQIAHQIMLGLSNLCYGKPKEKTTTRRTPSQIAELAATNARSHVVQQKAGRVLGLGYQP